MVTQAAQPRSLDELAEEFVRRYREGERPAIAEYVARFPELAEDIQQIFPMLVVFEEAGPGSSSLLGACPQEVTPVAAAPTQLGDYRILRCIGRGGMGVVYEAIQEPLGRHVALKVLSGNNLANPVLMERFRIEARAAASLHHTNIVPVFDVGEQDGTHYYAMQYIQGQSLHAVIQELRRLEDKPLTGSTQDDEEADNTARTLAQGLISGQAAGPQPMADATTEPGPPSVSLMGVPTVPDTPQPIATETVVATDSVTSGELNTQSRGQYFRRVASIGIQVAEALAYAHERGIVHRDVKPSNLLLDVQGRVWVTDFGLAKSEGSGELTRTGDVVGTLRYMAPERFKGKSDAVSDVYSLGVTLYELATRQPAFSGTNEAQLLLTIAKEDPPRPRQRDSHVPRDLETIIVKAMDKAPGRRYQSSVELAADLQRFIENKPIRARRTTRPERLWRWSRRNPALASLVALVTFVAVVGLPGVTWLWRAESAAREDLEIARAFDRLALAERKMAAHEILGGLELLDEIPRHMREWESVYLRQSWLREPIVIAAGTEGGAHCVAYHPDGRQFVTGNRDGSISWWDARTAQIVSTLPAHKAFVFSVAISTDGKHLISAAADGSITAWDWATKRPLRTWTGYSQGWLYGVAHAVAVDPNRPEFAAGDEHGNVIVRDIRGQVRFQLRAHDLFTPSIAYSRDGRFLASGDFSGEVKVWNVETRALAFNFSGNCRHPVSRLMFDPDGKWLYAACFDHRIWAFPLDGGEPQVLTGHTHIITAAVLSPNGRRIASVAPDFTVRLWDPHARREALTLQCDAQMLRAVAFSPNGRQLVAVGSRDIRIWEADPLSPVRGEERLSLAHDMEVWHAVVSPDGRQIAIGCADGTVHLWDAKTGEEVYVYTRHRQITFCANYSHDGRIVSVGPGRGRIDAELRIWDSATGEDKQVIRGDKTLFNAVFTPDGRQVVAGGSHGFIDVYDASTGEQVHHLPAYDEEVMAIWFNKDQTRMGSVSAENEVILWDVPGYEEHERFTLEDMPAFGSGIAFSPDGQLLAGCGSGGAVVLLDIPTKDRRELPGHLGHVSAVAFSPDGRIVASGGTDCTIRLWELASGKELRTLRGHTGPISSLYFNHDGTQLVSASRRDNTAKVWDVVP